MIADSRPLHALKRLASCAQPAVSAELASGIRKTHLETRNVRRCMSMRCAFESSGSVAFDSRRANSENRRVASKRGRASRSPRMRERTKRGYVEDSIPEVHSPRRATVMVLSQWVPKSHARSTSWCRYRRRSARGRSGCGGFSLSSYSRAEARSDVTRRGARHDRSNPFSRINRETGEVSSR